MSKYTVTKFPDPTGRWGSPWATDWWLLARLHAMVYYFRPGVAEVRITNSKTGETVVW